MISYIPIIVNNFDFLQKEQNLQRQILKLLIIFFIVFAGLYIGKSLAFYKSQYHKKGIPLRTPEKFMLDF